MRWSQRVSVGSRTGCAFQISVTIRGQDGNFAPFSEGRGNSRIDRAREPCCALGTASAAYFASSPSASISQKCENCGSFAISVARRKVLAAWSGDIQTVRRERATSDKRNTSTAWLKSSRKSGLRVSLNRRVQNVTADSTIEISAELVVAGIRAIATRLKWRSNGLSI